MAVRTLPGTSRRKMQVRIFIAAIVTSAFLTQVSYAQHASPPGPTISPKEKARLEEKRTFEKDTDEAYKSTLKKIPEGKQNVDPWGTLRTPTAPSGTK